LWHEIGLTPRSKGDKWKTIKAGGLDLSERLKAAGVIKDYEVFEQQEVSTRFSLDPSAFDYSKGTWRIPPSTTSVQDRQLVSADTAPIEFDEVDLRIAEMLKKSAATKPEAMATALGISLEEVEERLEKRAFDERRGFVLSNFVDFFEPGLFAPETAVITAFFRGCSEELCDALLKVPYLSVVRAGREGAALLGAGPLPRRRRSLGPFLLPPFLVAFHPAVVARSGTSISRGAKEGNARPWGYARSRVAMSWSLEVLPSSSSSF